MPAEGDLRDLVQLWIDDDDPPAPDRSVSKRDCARCSRPRSVCLCPWLPAAPLQTAGRVVILQHPHERKKRLATVPVLEKCLADIAVLRSRNYQPGMPQHAALQQALEGAAAGRYPLLLLFPGAGARDVNEVAAELSLGGSASTTGGSSDGCSSGGGVDCRGGQQQRQDVQQHDVQQQVQQQLRQDVQQQAQQQQPQQRQEGEQHGVKHQAQQRQQPSSAAAPAAAATAELAETEREPLFVLLVIDGTWKQAKEMFKGLRPYALQPEGPGIRVQLPPLAQQQGSAPAAGSCPQEERREAPGGAGAHVQQATADAGEQAQAMQGAGEQAAADAAEPAAAAQGAGAQAAAAQHGCGGEAAELERPLLLRMEPMEGCRTTCEAVARALGALEPQGRAVRDALLRPLAQLARFQAQWSPAVAARLETGNGYSRRAAAWA